MRKETNEKKKCEECDEVKPITDFMRSELTNDGRDRLCGKCRVEAVKAKVRRRPKNPAVQMVRELYATGEFTQAELGKLFHVSQSQISRIVNKKRWVLD